MRGFLELEFPSIDFAAICISMPFDDGFYIRDFISACRTQGAFYSPKARRLGFPYHVLFKRKMVCSAYVLRQN